MPASSDSETTQTGQDIIPWESTVCERLTEQIKSASSSKGDVHVQIPLRNLVEALKQTEITVRYNAKWFAEQALNTLLETALDAAAASSASADLYAAVTLIDTVVTYALLPSQRLEQAVRFLSQTYHSATRAYKTKRLADTAWKALRHILASHLGGQTVVLLLDIVDCRDESILASKAGYSEIAGAVMIISETMLMKNEERKGLSIPTLTPFLDSLWATVVNSNDNMRELIMEIIPVLLTDENVVSDLDAQSSWDVLLDTVEPCIALTPECAAVKFLVESLLLHVDRFEPRHLPTIAQLTIGSELPLTPQLKENILATWEDILPTRVAPNAYSRLLKELSKSTHYEPELQKLVNKGVIEIFLRMPERRSFDIFIGTLRDLAMDPATHINAADILAKALVTMFRHSVRFSDRDWEKESLFEALCKMSTRCIDAAKTLFSIRADVEGAVYVESGLFSQLFPVHSTSSSVTAVMHDASWLSLQDWHDNILTVLSGPPDSTTYNIFLKAMPSLLSNHSMFDDRIDFIQRTRAVVCELLENRLFAELPNSFLTKSQITMALVEILTAVLSYHRRLSKQELLKMVSIFLNIAGSRDHIVSASCIHALTICCYELPDLMSSYMDDVIDKMSKMVTQRYLAIDVLLFLAGLSRQPDLFHNFQTHDYKKIFGVCGSYLQSIRGASNVKQRQQPPASDQGSKTSADSEDALPQYVYALAHHVIAFWYLALKPHDRRGLKEYITSCLRYSSPDGNEIIEDQGLVTIDLMDRVDVEEEKDAVQEHFNAMDGRISRSHRLSGMLLITTETAWRNCKTIVTVRRATGTEKWGIQNGQFLARLSNEAEIAENRPKSISVTIDSSEDDFINIFPDDINGLRGGKVYVARPTSVLGSESVLTLPNDDSVTRAIQSFDRTSALDSHKCGLVYIGEGQSTEDEILQNRMGSPDYVEFAMNLGTLMRLKGADFNTQGLDRANDTDGEHAVVWHNQVTELVFHITTLMPNSDDISLNTANKKRHIGNNYVNIVFNNSGAPFDFNTFPSDFNFVYIIISPSARTSFIQTRTQIPGTDKNDRFYTVQVATRPGYPPISSAAQEKVISGASLPGYVRNLALNECVFSAMWAYRDEPGEYPSSWRSRLHQIRRFWERYGS